MRQIARGAEIWYIPTGENMFKSLRNRDVRIESVGFSGALVLMIGSVAQAMLMSIAPTWLGMALFLAFVALFLFGSLAYSGNSDEKTAVIDDRISDLPTEEQRRATTEWFRSTSLNYWPEDEP
jgi:hypothetical protein